MKHEHHSSKQQFKGRSQPWAIGSALLGWSLIWGTTHLSSPLGMGLAPVAAEETTDSAPTEAAPPPVPENSESSPAAAPPESVTPLDLSDLPEPDLPTRPETPVIATPIAPPVPAAPTTPIRPPAIQLQPGSSQPGSSQSPSLAPAVPPPPQLPIAARSTRPGPNSVVVLSERSSGCEATIQLGGDIPAGLCGYGQSQPPAFQGQTPYGVAVDGLGAFGNRSQGGANYYGRSTPPPALRALGDRAFLFPFANLVPITSSFGWRLHPLFGDWRLHTGTDFGAAWGTPVYAVQSGRVTISDFLGGYGLTVVTQDEAGVQEVLYGHLSEVFVQAGQWIEQGKPIGRVGSTGNSTGPHLHLELRQWSADGWIALDAEPYFQQTQLAQAQVAAGTGLGLPPFGPNAEAIGAIDWELQTLGAGFMDVPTPLEEMVTWLLDKLVQVQQIAQTPPGASPTAPIDPAQAAPSQTHSIADNLPSIPPETTGSADPTASFRADSFTQP